jgi:hypothetical protein
VLREIEEEIVAMHREGVSVDEAISRVRVEAYRRLPLAGERIEGAVRGVYAGLTGAK